MSKMFEMAEINQKITFSPQTRPADVFEMFANAAIQASPDLDLKKAEDLTGMFRDASIYAPLNINAPSAESMSEMFMGANISAKITFSPETRPVDVRKIFEDAYVKVLPDISIATDYDLPAMYRTTKYVDCQAPKQNREAPEQNRGSSVEKRHVSDELMFLICIVAPTTCANMMSRGRH